MLSQVLYLIRSKADGSYLVARPQPKSETATAPAMNPGYLLVFQEHFDALTYLNTHGSDVADRFAVESISGTQVETILKRWGFVGVGVVQDPLLPRVEFLARQSPSV